MAAFGCSLRFKIDAKPARGLADATIASRNGFLIFLYMNSAH